MTGEILQSTRLALILLQGNYLVACEFNEETKKKRQQKFRHTFLLETPNNSLIQCAETVHWQIENTLGITFFEWFLEKGEIKRSIKDPSCYFVVIDACAFDFCQKIDKCNAYWRSISGFLFLDLPHEEQTTSRGSFDPRFEKIINEASFLFNPIEE